MTQKELIQKEKEMRTREILDITVTIVLSVASVAVLVGLISLLLSTK